MRSFLLGAALAIGVFSTAAQAATIDLTSKGLQLGSELGSSTSMAISDTAPVDLGGFVIPGFFQALDPASSPALELNTGDGVSFNLSVTPGFTGVSTETARDGDRQLELIFGTDVFARFILADGDNLDNVLTGAAFGDASLTVWELESTTPVPLPAGLPLLIAGVGAFALVRRRSAKMAQRAA